MSRAAGFAILLICVSCRGSPEPSVSNDVSEYDGLTPEEIQLQAAPMSLEEAESLGIVDSTIRIEIPINPDTLLPLPIDTGG